MATTKQRIQVTLAPQAEKALAKLAKHDRVPVATKAAALLELALELEEDRYFSAVADSRMKGKVRWVRDSDTIWR